MELWAPSALAADFGPTLLDQRQGEDSDLSTIGVIEFRIGMGTCDAWQMGKVSVNKAVTGLLTQAMANLVGK